MRAERGHQPGLGVQVGEVHADRGRLEHVALVVLDDRDASERMAREVFLAAALLVAHHLELIPLPELLERPHDAQRTPGVFAVKDAHA